MKNKLYEKNGTLLKYDSVDIKQYIKLEQLSERNNKWKMGFLFVFFICMMLQLKFHKLNWMEFETTNKLLVHTLNCIVGFLAYGINFFIAYCLHKKAYKKVSEGGTTFTVNINFKEKKFIQIAYLFVSPDYFFANEFKELIKDAYRKGMKCRYKTCNRNCLKDRNGEGICLKNWDGVRIDIKYFVTYSNTYNIILAISIMLVTIMFWNYKGWLINTIFYVLIYRILSRFIEIAVAFYKDVTRVDDKLFADVKGENQEYVYNWKNSLLLKPARISLAIHSLIEIIILFSMLYYFISINYLDDDNLLKLKEAIGATKQLNFYNFLLFSLSVSAFNFSFASFGSLMWSTAHVLQVVLSLVLIILALATYLGNSNKLLERDEIFYLQYHETRMKEQK